MRDHVLIEYHRLSLTLCLLFHSTLKLKIKTAVGIQLNYIILFKKKILQTYSVHFNERTCNHTQTQTNINIRTSTVSPFSLSLSLCLCLCLCGSGGVMSTLYSFIIEFLINGRKLFFIQNSRQ